MSLQNDFATPIDSGLNRWNVDIWVARSDHNGSGRCACRRSDYRDDSDDQTSDVSAFHVCNLPGTSDIGP
jgi:hypothetical protein